METLKAIRSKNQITDQTKENRIGSKPTPTVSSEKPKDKNNEQPKMFLSFPNKDKKRGNTKPILLAE